MTAQPQTLRRWLFLGLALLVISGLCFYSFQNTSAGLPGGKIAPVKTLWLGTVLACRYLLPLFMLLDRRLQSVHWLIALLLFDMLARAVVEPGMMYLWHNWHPYYGIGHDLFSMILCVALATKAHRRLPIIGSYLLVMAVLFAVETDFAWYMLRHVSAAQGMAYYVPAAPGHLPVLVITAVVVGLTWIYLLYFIRVWLYQDPGHSSPVQQYRQQILKH